MSFRIEDILKKDSTRSAKFESKSVTEKHCPKIEDFSKSASLNSHSILEQTLLNKNNHYSQIKDYYTSEGLYSGVYNCDKVYLPPNYSDFYFGNANPYLSLYSRSRFYSTYETLPMMFHLSSKRKGGQVRFTSIQTDALEKRFNSHKYLSPEDRRILAESLKLSDKQVKTWFQNRRAKWRRCNSTSSSNTDIECEKHTESDSERTFCDRLIN